MTRSARFAYTETRRSASGVHVNELHTPTPTHTDQQNDLCKITKGDRKHTNHTHTHTNKGSMQIQRYSAGAKHESKQGPKHIVLIWSSNNKKHNSLKNSTKHNVTLN